MSRELLDVCLVTENGYPFHVGPVARWTSDLVAALGQVHFGVAAVEARRDARSGFIFTYVKLRLIEDLKGRSASTTVNLRLIGGKVDGIELVVVGMPQFKKGGESVLLLGKTNRAGYPVVMEARRGTLPIVRDKKGKPYLSGRITGFNDLKGRVSLDAFRTALQRQAKKEKK